MRYGLVLRINDRTYPFRYETAKELNLAIAEVIPNGITLRIGRAPDGSMVLGIKSFNPAIVQNFGLVNYVSRIYTVSTTPRWMPAKMIAAQSIVNGVVKEGPFGLDPAVKTKSPWDESFNAKVWKNSQKNYLLAPKIPEDIVYLDDDPMVRVGVFKFRTPKVKLYKLPAEGEEIVFEKGWHFRSPYALTTSCDIMDENKQIVPGAAGYRDRWFLEFDKDYYFVIRSASPAADDRVTHDTAYFWPFMMSVTATHRMYWEIEDWSQRGSTAGLPYVYDMSDLMFSRSAVGNFVSTNTYTFRFTCTKNELSTVTGSGWLSSTINRFLDLTTGDPIEFRTLAGRVYYQLFKDHTYELTITRGGWSDEYNVNAATTLSKYTFVDVDKYTDQPLLTRKQASWMDWTGTAGHSQTFAPLDPALKAQGYKGICFGMTIVSKNYTLRTYDYYPFIISVYDLDETLAFMAGTGPLPKPLITASENPRYNTAAPIASWAAEGSPIIEGKQYIVEVLYKSTTIRMINMIYPTETTFPVANKPADKIQATIAEIEKQMRIPIRVNTMKTYKRG